MNVKIEHELDMSSLKDMLENQEYAIWLFSRAIEDVKRYNLNSDSVEELKTITKEFDKWLRQQK